MKHKTELKRVLRLVLAVTVIGIMAGCSDKSASLSGVKSITLEQQAMEIEGHREAIRVMPDGLLEQESSAADGVSAGKSVINPGDFEKLVEILEKNKFTELPDDVSTQSADGAILTIIVETENETFRKGGLNPDNQDFMNCYNECMELLQ